MDQFYNDFIKLPLKHAWEFVAGPKYNVENGVNVLGTCCRTKEELYKHAFSRPFLTFRKNFLPSQRNKTSDTGFGCMVLSFITSQIITFCFLLLLLFFLLGMIRSGSMVVAEAIQRSMMGKDFISNEQDSVYCPRQIWLASLFTEEMSENTRHKHPFSIQHLMALGETFGKREGEWFAPGTIAAVYKYIFENYCEEQLNMSIYLCEPGFNTVFEV